MNPPESERDKIVSRLREQLYGTSNQYADKNEGLDFIRKDIPEEILVSRVRPTYDFNNWFKERVGRTEAPGLAIFDPRVDLKAVIIAVHGLGLYRGAYRPFANRICHDGFGVISFDVRGFGSYRNDEIYQKVDFDGIIADLHGLLMVMRARYQKIPIYVLGESMGGAIALRLAALYPDLMDGVICSVPSGSRFQAKSTALDIAVKLLHHPHGQFNIGTKVVGQATDDQSLRNQWQEDPEARMKLSAVDLVKFQHFMNENIKFAERVKSTPVIIYQGYSDRLVKPLGTLALYQALSVRDKDLVFVGRAEHLIFEEGQFVPAIVDSTISWLNQHIAMKDDHRSLTCGQIVGHASKIDSKLVLAVVSIP